MNVSILFSLCFLVLHNSTASSFEKDYKPWYELGKDGQNQILESQNLHPLIKAYYNESFRLSDDSVTFSLLEVLTDPGPDQGIVSLKIYLFSQICLHSDGALSEAMGALCIRLLRNETGYTLAYLHSDEALKSKFISFMAYEFALKEQGLSDIPLSADSYFRDLKTSSDLNWDSQIEEIRVEVENQIKDP